MNRKLARSLLSLTAAGALLGATGAVALADALPQAPLMDEVFALQNTPHLFFLDEHGAVHLASDPQALAGIDVDWLARRNVTLDELRQYRRGEPILSLALVKIGDAIYLPQAPIDDSADPLSYEYGHAARREQYYGELRWGFAKAALLREFGNR